jgi:hypothetical protein
MYFRPVFLLSSADGVQVGQRVLLIDGDELGAEAQSDDRHVELFLVGHA